MEMQRRMAEEIARRNARAERIRVPCGSFALLLTSHAFLTGK